MDAFCAPVSFHQLGDKWCVSLVPIDLPHGGTNCYDEPLDPDDYSDLPLPDVLCSLIFEFILLAPIDAHRIAAEFPQWIRKHADLVDNAMDSMDQDLLAQTMCVFAQDGDWSLLPRLSSNGCNILYFDMSREHYVYHQSASVDHANHAKARCISCVLSSLVAQLQSIITRYAYQWKIDIEASLHYPEFWCNMSMRHSREQGLIQHVSSVHQAYWCPRAEECKWTE